jgi:phage gp37-like protein
MSTATVSTIEQGMVSTLEAAIIPSFGGTVSSYAGQLEEAMQGVEVDVPAVLVAFEGMYREDDASSFGSVGVRMIWSVTVMARSFLGGDSARTGTAGAYALADAVQAALFQSDLGLSDFSGLHFQQVQLALARKTLAAYRIEYYCFGQLGA